MPNTPAAPGGRRPPNLDEICAAVERVMELVPEALTRSEGPEVRDWNDRLLVEAFARAYRCLRSIRELACEQEAEDAAVLTRALVSLTLRYLWLSCSSDDPAVRSERPQRLQRKWTTERADLGEELIELGHVPDDLDRARQFQEQVQQFRARAEELQAEGVRGMPSELQIAEALDRELEPASPRFFELLYTRIYRPTSHVAHYGVGAAVAGIQPDNIGEISLNRLDESGSEETLGLALVTFAAFLDFSQPVIRHGATETVAEIVRNLHG